MDPKNPKVTVVIMHDHGMSKEQNNMNKNCPHKKINLQVGFLNLNKCNMAWHI